MSATPGVLPHTFTARGTDEVGRAYALTYEWQHVPANADLDEDYYLVVASYLVVVGTRADFTSWSIYGAGGYGSTALRSGGRAFEAHEVTEAVAANELGAMAEAEAALAGVLG